MKKNVKHQWFDFNRSLSCCLGGVIPLITDTDTIKKIWRPVIGEDIDVDKVIASIGPVLDYKIIEKIYNYTDKLWDDLSQSSNCCWYLSGKFINGLYFMIRVEHDLTYGVSEDISLYCTTTHQALLDKVISNTSDIKDWLNSTE